MRKTLVGILALLACTVAWAQSSTGSQWWSYLAAYGDTPGSVRVDLGLRKKTPVEGYSNLIITGVSYTSTQKDHLPAPADLDRLNKISDAVVAAIAKKTPSIHAGTFTHNFEQLNYIYVQKTEGLDKVVAKVYAKLCDGCKTQTNIRPDPSWSAYRDFLFPNDATRIFYKLKLD
jgi:hypothetical protein